jgi:hypothetical protein
LTINVLEGDDPSDMMPTQLSSTETTELGSGTFTLPVNNKRIFFIIKSLISKHVFHCK